MSRLIVSTAFVCALMVAGGMTRTVGAQATTLTGKWAVDVKTERGGGAATFTFKQAGTKLTGRYKGTFGESDVAGTVKGNTFKFAFGGERDGRTYEIAYEGTLDKDTIKGTMKISGVGPGVFNGKRQ